MPPLVAAHLLLALAWLCTGVGIGLFMAFGHDFTLKPVHAHVNLLGWVTNALFGIIHWLAGRAGRIAWIGFGVFNTGAAVMVTGLTGVLLGIDPLKPGIAIGAPLVCAGILIVFGQVIAMARTPRTLRRQPALA